MPADTIIFDLETTRDVSLPAYKPEEPDAFAPPPYHRVEMVGALFMRGDKAEKLGVIDHGAEAHTIGALLQWLRSSRAKAVTFNGRRFDLPVLTARSMLHGIGFGWRFGMKRWELGQHEDVADSLSDFGAAPATSLDVWSRMCGWPGKLDESGKSVESLLADGRRDHLRAYCMADVALTTALWMRANLLRGDWELERYQPAALSLLTLVRTKPELAIWADRIDQAVWLLTEIKTHTEAA